MIPPPDFLFSSVSTSLGESFSWFCAAKGKGRASVTGSDHVCLWSHTGSATDLQVANDRGIHVAAARCHQEPAQGQRRPHMCRSPALPYPALA